MENKLDLKKIWKQQHIETSEIKELHKKAVEFKRKYLFKLIIINMLMLVTSILIFLIWHYYKPELLSTKIGIVLIILAMATYTISYNKVIPLLLKNDAKKTSKEFIKEYINLKKKQKFQQKTMLSFYFLFLSLGILMYLFEPTIRMTFFSKIAIYGFTLIWIAINWFYFRPKVIQKQNKKINKLLVKLKEIENQSL